MIAGRGYPPIWFDLGFCARLRLVGQEHGGLKSVGDRHGRRYVKGRCRFYHVSRYAFGTRCRVFGCLQTHKNRQLTSTPKAAFDSRRLPQETHRIGPLEPTNEPTNDQHGGTESLLRGITYYYADHLGTPPVVPGSRARHRRVIHPARVSRVTMARCESVVHVYTCARACVVCAL